MFKLLSQYYSLDAFHETIPLSGFLEKVWVWASTAEQQQQQQPRLSRTIQITRLFLIQVSRTGKVLTISLTFCLHRCERDENHFGPARRLARSFAEHIIIDILLLFKKGFNSWDILKIERLIMSSLFRQGHQISINHHWS